jgi:hypothetical protein
MKNLFNCLILALLFAACKRTEPALKQDEVAGLPDDFVSFYEHFHADSAYQMAHITFPLEGYPTAPDSATLASKFHWKKEEWLMHRGKMFIDSLYTRRFEAPMPTVITETIIQKDQPVGTYRRFMKREDGWYLIFYSDMNRMDSKN